MHKQISFLITATILIAAVATVALYTVNVANAQSANMTMKAPGGNMTKNMTASAGNMTKNMTASAGNMTAKK
ncbi:MAG TPA: hypothetical protein VFI73_02820 [Candidatus Nitrosopolaris sp.]|nr:hypothetical protein [Candidatus Nitrosopolaris sp.]